MATLEISHLSAFYGKGRFLHDISLKLGKGAAVAVIGANGAGKSTLMDTIMGLTKITGVVHFDGTSFAGKGSSDIVEMGIGYAPERFNLFPYISVEDNPLVGTYTARVQIV